MTAGTVTLNLGSGGDGVATDEIAGAEYQRVKLVDGTIDGTDAIASGNGTSTNALRVTVSSDSTGVLSVDDNGGSLTVDSTALTDIETNTDFGAVTGGGTEATALRVTIANDSTGVLSVDDGGGSLTVDGTITANLGATDNAVLDSIDAAVNGTLTVGSHAVTNAGTFVVQEDGAALTALQTIDNSIFADDAAFTLATDSVNMAGAIRDDSLSTLTAIEGDAVPLRVSSTGALHVTGGGGGTEYTEDAAAPANPTGTASLMERDDALAGLTPIEGDWTHQYCNNNGALWTAVDGTVTVDLAGNNDVTIDNSSIVQAEDSVHTTGDAGVMVFGVRQDTQADFGADGDYVPFSIDADGAIRVNAINAEGTQTDDAAFTPGTSTVAMMGGTFDDTTPDSVDEGDGGAVRMSANRNLYVTLRDAAGNERGLNIDANNNLNAILASNSGVDIGDVDVLSVIPGTGATNLGKAVDAAAGGTDTGVPPLAVRDDTLSALTPAEGDYVPLRVNSTGALHVTGAGGGTQFNVDDAAGGTDTGTVTLAVRDDSLTTLTPVDGDYVPLRVSSTGALHVTGGGGGTEYNEDVATPATITGTATMMERDDALATLTPIEGDWAGMRCTAEGALWTQDFNSDAILADTNTLAGAVAGSEMQVDVVTSALPTGAATQATLADVETNTDFGAVTGGGVEASALRVTLANDSTGVVSIDDNGGSLTVDGTVTANLSATDNAVLDQIELNTSYGDNTGNGTAAGALRVTVASDSTGSLAVDLGANNDVTIDNSSIVQAEDAVHGSGDAGVMSLAVRNDVLAALAGTDGDYAPVQVTAEGAVYQTPAVSVGSVGTTTFYDSDLDETEVEVDTGPVNIYSIQAFNTTDAPLFLQLFNTNTVTVGTTTPTNQYVIPGNADSDGAGFSITFAVPKTYDTALSIACTTGSETAGAPGAGACICNIEYAT